MIDKAVKSPRLVLASGSPRRVELLNQIGIDCDVFPTDIDETVATDELAKDYVMRLARQKAQACLERLDASLSHQPIIAADTTVVYSNRILGKPESPEDAVKMLQLLAGKMHHVHTAVSLAFNGELNIALSTTAVEMIAMTTAQIEAYVATGEHKGKAGSYGIQGAAATWIKRIDGSYSGVMGLPLYQTAELLRKIDFID
jgi:septum formation protein